MMTIYIQLVEMEVVGAGGASELPFTFIDNFLCRILILCISRAGLSKPVATFTEIFGNNAS